MVSCREDGHCMEGGGFRMDYFSWGRWSLQGRWFLLRGMEMVPCSSSNRGLTRHPQPCPPQGHCATLWCWGLNLSRVPLAPGAPGLEDAASQVGAVLKVTVAVAHPEPGPGEGPCPLTQHHPQQCGGVPGVPVARARGLQGNELPSHLPAALGYEEMSRPLAALVFCPVVLDPPSQCGCPSLPWGCGTPG